jgi:hypothetical protein
VAFFFVPVTKPREPAKDGELATFCMEECAASATMAESNFYLTSIIVFHQGRLLVTSKGIAAFFSLKMKDLFGPSFGYSGNLVVTAQRRHHGAAWVCPQELTKL